MAETLRYSLTPDLKLLAQTTETNQQPERYAWIHRPYRIGNGAPDDPSIFRTGDPQMESMGARPIEMRAPLAHLLSEIDPTE
jgi:hypothetical protein